ncbi:YwiC-like family protein [Paenibacillus sp. 481]|uniref:YwiC-like family protein n=1 Tax=Paenibacillus sp. 481 TaxID=2835869 RepID=UPI001E6317C8|nr:YwiC-like family protein [Paenibacillus sp. 481]UHA74274.1 YwiC-like family protein [Paenibacillus sp. 481]
MLSRYTICNSDVDRYMRMLRASFPNQHGAWAMLIVPFLIGMFAAKPNWTHLWLALAWFAAYCTSFAVLQWVKTGKEWVYKQPCLIYGRAFVLFAAILLFLRPDVWWMGAVMLPLFRVNMWYAKRKEERHLGNDIIAVAQFCWMLIIAFEVGGGTDWGLAWRAFAVCMLYFVGAVLYVKTMIREKGSPTYYAASLSVHLIAAIAAGLMISPWVAVPYGVLFLRAVWMPNMKVTVRQVGLGEIAFVVATTGVLIAAL